MKTQHCDKCKAQQEQWDAIPNAFNEWWNADYDDTGNPYRKDSPAYWAWSGWKAASKQPAQRSWVGLTEQEAAECWSTSTVRTWQAIEAKLKEKNTC